MKRLHYAVALALLLPASASFGDKSPDAALVKMRQKLVKSWLDLAEYLTGKGMKTAASAALDQALAADAEAAGITTARTAVDALTADTPLDDEAKGRRDKTAHEAAKSWEKLVDLLGGALDEPPAAQALSRAVMLDPTKPRLAKWIESAKKDIALVESPDHAMAAWITLPSGWKPGKEYPILVTVDGAGANFVQSILQFKGVRASRDVILLTPYALSCTNELQRGKYPLYSRDLLKAYEDQMKRVDFDVAGLERIHDVVKERLGGAPKLMITGFSGGGFLAYAFTMRKPERVALLAPACPNYRLGLDQGGVQVKDGAPIVRIFTGGADPHKDKVGEEHGIEYQTDAAVRALESLGYKDLKRKMLPGVGHSACAPQVFTAVDELLETR